MRCGVLHVHCPSFYLHWGERCHFLCAGWGLEAISNVLIITEGESGQSAAVVTQKHGMCFIVPTMCHKFAV